MHLARLPPPSGSVHTRCLVVRGQRRVLTPDRAVVVGSGGRSDVRLEVDGVAPRHAAFALGARGAGVSVEDLGSTTGTWLRGARRGGHALDGDAAVLLGREPVLVAEALPDDAIRWHGIVARDPRALENLERLARVASARAPVWLAGESGTGKEATARAIHAESARADGPYVALNCAAVPEGLAEAELFGATRGAFTGAVRPRAGAFVKAHGGTLLLDEIGELSLAVQAKLLRVLETGEVLPVGADRPVKVDVRIVASTWRDLAAEAAARRFRHDLLHRLWVLKLELAPLRERPEDIPALVGHMLMAGGAPELMPGSALLKLLERYDWPGNVRELRNFVERAIAFHDPLAMVPDEVRGARLPRRSSRGPRQADGTRLLIRDALRTYGNHRGRAARALGVSRSTLYRWFKEASCPGRVDTLPAPFMMAQASRRET